MFTELPHDFKLATINVDGGTASNLVVGVPFAWYGVTGGLNGAAVVSPAIEANREDVLIDRIRVKGCTCIMLKVP